MIIDALRGGLIVSCQPVAGGPMDRTDIISAFGLAAIQGGAVALRVEGHKNVHAMRKSTQTPLIGLVKRDLQSSPVRITPLMTDVEALIEAGADIIAFDATDRPRPEPIRDLLDTVHRGGKLAMADCSSLDDGQRALDLGADLIGTTLSGYVGDKEPESPDLTLVSALAAFSPNIIAEGRYRTPEQAARAMRHGALAVVVGSAITRTEHVTSWFCDAVTTAGSLQDVSL